MSKEICIFFSCSLSFIHLDTYRKKQVFPLSWFNDDIGCFVLLVTLIIIANVVQL